MGRIRTVKPETFLSEDLFDLERASKVPVRLAYIGLWTVADREGRFEWKPRQLKAAILPHDQLDFAKVLDALERSGRVERYTVDGREYGWIRSWKHHQVINNKERDSVIPIAPGEAIPDCAEVTRDGRDDDALSTREERVPQGKERKARGERVGNGNGTGTGTGMAPAEPERKGREPEGSREGKGSRGTGTVPLTGTETHPPFPPEGGNLASSKNTKRGAERVLASLQLNDPSPIEVFEAACSEAIAMYPNETENQICEHLVRTRRRYEKFATDNTSGCIGGNLLQRRALERVGSLEPIAEACMRMHALGGSAMLDAHNRDARRTQQGSNKPKRRRRRRNHDDNHDNGL